MTDWSKFTFDTPTNSQPVDWSKFDFTPEEEKKPKRTLAGTVKDVGITALKGAIGVPEAAVGLADIVTGGHVGKFLENEGGAVGFRPKQAKEIPDENYSDAQKYENAQYESDKVKNSGENPNLIQEAGGTIKALAQHPSVAVNSVIESMPSMFAGGAAGKALAGASKLAPYAGNIGEGLMMGGAAEENIRQQTADGLTTPKQSALALGTGLIGGGISAAGGKLAKQFGVSDIDAVSAGQGLAQNTANKGLARRVIEGAAIEGGLEEMPQSAMEQAMQNAALDKPIMQGVGDAAGMGLVAGGLMGGGMGVLHKNAPVPVVTPPPELAAQPQPNAPQPEVAQPTPYPSNIQQDDVTRPVRPNFTMDLAGKEVAPYQQGEVAPIAPAPEIKPNSPLNNALASGGISTRPQLAQLQTQNSSTPFENVSLSSEPPLLNSPLQRATGAIQTPDVINMPAQDGQVARVDKNGFPIREYTTPEQMQQARNDLAPQFEQPKRVNVGGRIVDTEKHNLAQAVIALGGINKENADGIYGGSVWTDNSNKGNLFRNGDKGRTLGEMHEALVELGYLPQDSDKVTDVIDLLRSQNPKQIYSTNKNNYDDIFKRDPDEQPPKPQTPETLDDAIAQAGTLEQEPNAPRTPEDDLRDALERIKPYVDEDTHYELAMDESLPIEQRTKFLNTYADSYEKQNENKTTTSEQNAAAATNEVSSNEPANDIFSNSNRTDSNSNSPDTQQGVKNDSNNPLVSNGDAGISTASIPNSSDDKTGQVQIQSPNQTSQVELDGQGNSITDVPSTTQKTDDTQATAQPEQITNTKTDGASNTGFVPTHELPSGEKVVLKTDDEGNKYFAEEDGSEWDYTDSAEEITNEKSNAPDTLGAGTNGILGRNEAPETTGATTAAMDSKVEGDNQAATSVENTVESQTPETLPQNPQSAEQNATSTPILNTNGKPVTSFVAARGALKKQGLTETHTAVKQDDGSFVAVPNVQAAKNENSLPPKKSFTLDDLLEQQRAEAAQKNENSVPVQNSENSVAPEKFTTQVKNNTYTVADDAADEGVHTVRAKDGAILATFKVKNGKATGVKTTYKDGANKTDPLKAIKDFEKHLADKPVTQGVVGNTLTQNQLSLKEIYAESARVADEEYKDRDIKGDLKTFTQYETHKDNVRLDLLSKNYPNEVNEATAIYKDKEKTKISTSGSGRNGASRVSIPSLGYNSEEHNGGWYPSMNPRANSAIGDLAAFLIKTKNQHNQQQNTPVDTNLNVPLDSTQQAPSTKNNDLPASFSVTNQLGKTLRVTQKEDGLYGVEFSDGTALAPKSAESIKESLNSGSWTMADSKPVEKTPKNKQVADDVSKKDEKIDKLEKPADYGASNKYVTQSRADELRAKLKAKLGQLNSGIDPEMVAMGTELAVFHIEAGVRKFADLAQQLASDLDTSLDKLKPFLRSWYNGARDMLEDFGENVDDMDSPDTVKAELKKLFEAKADTEKNSTTEKEAPLKLEDLAIGDYVVAIRDRDIFGTEPLRVEHRNGVSNSIKVAGKGAHFDVSNFKLYKKEAEYLKEQSESKAAKDAATDTPETKSPTSDEVLSAVKAIRAFVPIHQIDTIGSATRGEEGLHFKNLIIDLAKQFNEMPKTYEQDGLGDKAVAHLHYFTGSQDWYITEKDKNTTQHQAFGYADFHDGFGEMGYISLVELATDNKVELDLHWTPKTIAEIKGKEEPTEKIARISNTSNTEQPKGDIPSVKLVGSLTMELGNKEGAIDKKTLHDLAKDAFGGTQAQGAYSTNDATDALEAAFNLHLQQTEGRSGKDWTKFDAHEAKIKVKELTKRIQALPTQTVRDAEKDNLQQFSTPPALSFVANWVANVTDKDTMLEPSAGTGDLAIWSKIAGAKILLNEISPRRLEILRALFPKAQLFKENGEQLNNVLPNDAIPTVVVMNPPFSSSATTSKNNTMNGAKHIEQALARLQDGGRLVAIVGNGMAADRPAFKNWWNDISKKYNVRANIGISGKEYAKYGTTFDNQILVFDKTGATTQPILTGKVESVAELPALLESIRNERQFTPAQQTGGKNSQSQQNTIQSENGNSGVNASDSSTGQKPNNDRRGGFNADNGLAESTDEETRNGNEDNGRKQGGANSSSDNKATNAGSGSSSGDIAGNTKQPANERQSDGSSEIDADVLKSINKQISKYNAAVDKQGNLTTLDGERVGYHAVINGDKSEVLKTSNGEHYGNNVVAWVKFSKELFTGIGTTNTSTNTNDKKDTLDISATENKSNDDFTDSIFSNYTPQKLHIAGAKPHPAQLVQSAAMAAVEPPTPTYSPTLPKEVITEGKLSIAQLEAVVYAGQAHSEILPNGERKGFFIGDNTGVGKGREISGVILDNMNQGKKKAVWVSFNEGLMNDAKRDYEGVGGNSDKIFFQGKTKPKDSIQAKDGILFTSYTTVASGSKQQANDLGQEKGQSRLEQIINWLGADFDGVIAFDEAHKMGNAEPIKGKRGTSKPSQQAIAGINLQKALPKARIVYVSATGATELSNLAYATRLGLWGEGTPFANSKDFIQKVSQGGIAAMELVSRDMKALGMYISRSISYDGVSYERLDAQMTPLQIDIYNELAKAWQTVLQNVNAALEKTGGAENGAAKSSAMSAFWGSQQRFFSQVITALQTPAVIDDIQKRLDNGEAVLVQIVNTNEATQERMVAQAKSDGTDLEDLDFTPREMLMSYIRNSFPVQAYQDMEDEGGNLHKVPVRDSNGNPVFDKEAIAMRDNLLNTLQQIRVPENPIDSIINAFGTDAVAEVTGRGRRFVQTRNDDGEIKVVEQKRSKTSSQADAKAYQDDKKKILIFSGAGGTGYSFHADNTAVNKRKRIHYIMQAGWKADAAVQGFGRSHRSNQAQPPHYVLPMTHLKAQKRFVSSIARRLDQLGAMTKGQRQTTSQGMFTAADNLESDYALEALHVLFKDMYVGRTQLNFHETATELGLNLFDSDGNFSESKIPTIPQFLNRLLSLTDTRQDQVFEEFEERINDAVEYAKQRGTYDEGVQTLKANSIKKTRDDVAHTDSKTGATTRYVELSVENDVNYSDWNQVKQTIDMLKKSNKYGGFYQLTRGVRAGQIILLSDNGTRLNAQGQEVHRGALYGIRQGSPSYIDSADILKQGFKNEWNATTKRVEKIEISKQIDEADAKAMWEAQIAAAPKTETKTERMIVGVILPIWDRLQGSEKIMRMQTDDGEQLLGRMVSAKDSAAILKNLGLDSSAAKLTPVEMLKQIRSGAKAVLANGWEIFTATVNGEKRIEIKPTKTSGFSTPEQAILKSQGVFHERIAWVDRFFIPTDNNDTFKRIVDSKPVVDLIGGKSKDEQLADFHAQSGRGARINPSKTQSNANAYTKESLESALKNAADSAFGKGWFNRLIATGKFKIIDSNEVKAFTSETGVQAFYHNGTTYFVADGIAAKTDLIGLLKHEIGVHALKMGKDDAGFQSILKQIEAMRGKNAAVDEAFAAAERAGTSAENMTEEALGYFVEKNPKHKLTDRIVAWFKKMIAKLTGNYQFDPAELHEMAREALRKAPDELIFNDPTDSEAIVKASKEGYKGKDAGEAKEWLNAVAKGLDMSHAARMQRAKDMGFDVEQKWYHGTSNKAFNEFSKHAQRQYEKRRTSGDESISFSSSPDFASRYANSVEGKENGTSHVLPVFIKTKNAFDFRNKKHLNEAAEWLMDYWKEHPTDANPKYDAHNKLELLKDLERGYWGIIEHDLKRKLDGTDFYEYRGFEGAYATEQDTLNFIAYQPENIRSIFAAFDPDEEDSANLLASKTTVSDIFKPIAEQAAKFKAALDKLMNNSLVSRPQPITVSEEPSYILKAVGVPNLPIIISKDTVLKATNLKKEGHDTPMSVIEKIPDILANPVMVLDSPSKDGGLIILSEYKDSSNRPVMISLHLDKQVNYVSVNRIASVYGRKDSSYFVNLAKNGNARYINEEKSRKWAQSERVQYPMGAFPKQGSKYNYITEKDLINSETVKFSKTQPSNDFEIPEETMPQKQQRLWQDMHNRWTTAINTIKAMGGKINESNNVYDALERMPHIAAERITDFKRETLNPLIERVARAKTNFDDIATLLYAMHAPERNAEMQKINPRFKNGNGSGMTDADAKLEIQKLKAKYGADYATFEAIAKDFQAITQQTAQLLEQSGAISSEEAARYKDTYKSYVPLKGFEVLDEKGNRGNGNGLGNSTAKKFGKRALGRESRAGQILENIIRDHERAIVWQGKAEVGAVVEKLINDNPDTIGTVQKIPLKPVAGKKLKFALVDAADGEEYAVVDSMDEAILRKDEIEHAMDGANVKIKKKLVTQVTSTPAPFDAETEIRFLRDGKEVRIQLNDDLLLQSYNRLGESNLNGVFAASAELNRYLRQMWTQKNPAFFLINPIRDIQTAAVVLTGEGGVKLAAKAMKNWRSSWATMARHATETESKLTAEERDILKRYRESGGSIGTAYISSLEKAGDDLHHALARHGGETFQSLIKAGEYKKAMQSAAFSVLNNRLFDLIEHLNTAFEGATRLATFKAAVDSGYSDMQAASLSSNVTVNFTKRGELGQQLGAMYLFANANIQGTANIFKTLTESNYKGQAWGIVGGIVTLSFMAAMMGGDDGEDDLVSDYEKERNISIDIGGGTRITIPVAYGWSFFKDIGRAFAQIANGGDAEKISKKLTSSFLGNFSPIGNPIPNGEFSSDNALVAFAPTVTKPFVMPTVNKGAFGTPLMPVSPFKPNQPDSEKIYRKTRGTGYEDIAKGLNSITGGDSATSGWIDVSPETIKNTINYIAGGAGRFLTDASALTTTPFNDEAFKLENTPIMKSFYKSESIDDYRRRFYAQSDDVTKVVEQLQAYKKERNATEFRELYAEKGKLIALNKQVTATKKQLQALRDREDIARANGSSTASIEAQERQLLARFNAMYAR